jgi:hypothetical protein
MNPNLSNFQFYRSLIILKNTHVLDKTSIMERYLTPTELKQTNNYRLHVSKIANWQNLY